MHETCARFRHNGWEKTELSSSEIELRQYLLGNLPDADAERLEEEYFVDDHRFGALLAAEDDLIESFLRRTLTVRERERFEERFLGTERNRRKVAIAAALAEVSAATAPMPRRAWTLPIAAAAVIVILAAGAAVLREVIVTSRNVKELAGEVETLRKTKAAPAAPAPAQGVSLFPIVLRPLERGTSANAVVLPANASADFWLVLPRDEFASYTVALESVEGDVLLTARSLKTRPLDDRKAVVFHVPAASLRAKTYIVALSGESDGSTEPVEDFSFTVRRP